MAVAPFAVCGAPEGLGCEEAMAASSLDSAHKQLKSPTCIRPRARPIAIPELEPAAFHTYVAARFERTRAGPMTMPVAFAFPLGR